MYKARKLPNGCVEINGYIFPPGTALQPTPKQGRADGLSAQRAQTMRREAEIASGRHPMGGPLREPAGETCGSCRHAVSVEYYPNRYWKCGLMRAQWTKGPGTDIRKKWPACSQWESDQSPAPPPPPEPDPMAPALSDGEGPDLAPELGGR